LSDKPASAEGFVKPTMIMFLATVIGGSCNYVYQFFMMKSLTVESYSELAAVLSLFYIISVPTQTVSTMLLRYTSKFVAEGRREQISWLMRRTLWITLGITFVMVVALLISMPWLVEFLSLTSDLPLMIMLFGLVVAMVTPIGYGPGQGLQRFGLIGLNTITWPIGKLLFGVLLVIAGFGVAGAMGGVVIGSVFGLLVVFIGVRDHLVKTGLPISVADARSIKIFLIPATIAAVCYGIMTNVDIFLANHYLDKTGAGLYSTASTLGKIILFMPGAIGAVMFPKVTQAHTRSEGTVRVMRRSIMWNLTLTGMLALAFLLVPETVLGLLSTTSYLGAAPALQVVGISMMFFGLGVLFMNYGLATDRHQYIFFMLLFTVVEVVLLILFHSTPVEISYDMLVTGVLMCFVSWAYMELKWRSVPNY
jgi:O-antigen/teichoic acid export membrane protein